MADDPVFSACRGRIGELLAGAWRLDALIGIGGMAAVYLATRSDGTMAALKLLHPEIAAIPEARSRFLKEAQIAASVEHPGTVKVLATESHTDGTPFFVMELLQGDTVEARVEKSGGRLPFREAVQIAIDTLEVLAAAHGRGVIHRDIKPANLFLSKKGSLKVLDFGIARLMESNEVKATLNRTKTGMAMGTPAFMAPEQALGRWSQVDARTDLWAVGATLYTMITGGAVHEGSNVNELLISAATRPVPSLGRVIPHAPVELVAAVDRALSFDRGQRFASAEEMRQALTAALAAAEAVGAQRTIRPPGGGGNAGSEAETVVLKAPSEEAPATVDDATVRRPAASAADDPSASLTPRRSVPPPAEAVNVVDAARMTPAEKSALREAFLAIDRVLHGTNQYGKDHVETRRRFVVAFTKVSEALSRTEDGLVWNVTPYSFQAGDTAIWEPEAPFDLVPYRLFAAGLRTLGFLPGLTRDELAELMRIATLDPARDLLPEDDMVTLLWDACFEHIAFEAVDAFAEGDQSARADFARRVEGVIQACRADYRADVERAANALRKASDDGTPTSGKPLDGLLMQLVAAQHAIDTEAAARARIAGVGGLKLGSALDDAVRVDERTRTVLAARLQIAANDASERFVVVVATALIAAKDRGKLGPLTGALRASIDSAAASKPLAAAELVASVCSAIAEQRPEPAAMRCEISGLILSVEAMRAIVTAATSPGEERSATERTLGALLSHLDDTHFADLLKLLSVAEVIAIRPEILLYLKRTGVGHEAEIGALLASADVELGLAIVRLLADLGTKAARDAIAIGTKNPHALIRIEALGHLEGHSSERLRVEIGTLLEDKDANVRTAALKLMSEHLVRAAGPYLVIRIKRADFDDLPLDERRLALATVSVLTAARAEALCVDLLEARKIFSPDKHEETRAIAAELLATVASSDEAKEALRDAAGRKLMSSARVRRAAEEALAAIGKRPASMPPKGASLRPPPTPTGEPR